MTEICENCGLEEWAHHYPPTPRNPASDFMKEVNSMKKTTCKKFKLKK